MRWNFSVAHGEEFIPTEQQRGCDFVALLGKPSRAAS